MDFKQDFKFNQAAFINFINLNSQEKKMVRNWRNDIKIRKWMLNNKLISPGEHIRFINNLRDDDRRSYWLVRNEKKEKYLGVVYLNKIDYKNKSAYCGIYINPSSLSKGLGAQVINCLKDLVFNIFAWHTLKLEVIASNKRAISFYKRLGFTREGKLKECINRDRKWHDLIIMGIVNRKST